METEVRPLVPWRAPKNVVLQHNALSEASYRLSVRAQKLLIRLLDELDQRGDNFCDIKLFLKDFSGLLSADPPETVKRFLDSSALFVYEIHLERVDCVRAYR